MEIWDGVDVEQLYRHVLTVEGERHPLYSPERMEECATYVMSKLDSYGLETNEQEFTLNGSDDTFRNVEGVLGGGDGPELLIVSHYDTVRHAPGANDNGSAIAVMLEAARVLSKSEFCGNVRFISFNLEEGNPVRASRAHKSALNHHITDEKGRYTSWRTAKLMKRFYSVREGFLGKGVKLPQAYEQTLGRMREELQDNELNYLKDLLHLASDITTLNWPGRTGLIGSSEWVKNKSTAKQSVGGVICLETIGYTSSKPSSQHFPAGLNPEMFRIYGTKDDLTVGDFLAIIGDQNSSDLATALCGQCENSAIDLPYACLQEDFSYEQAAHFMRDLLRSDHAPFWREGIPALMLTDSANFRYPFFHTHADTIDKLDFDFLSKVCKVTVATALNFSSEKISTRPNGL